MNPAQVTAFLIVVVSIFILIDVKLNFDKTPGNTYSEVIRNTGNRHPWFRALFMIGWGFVAGHWWW